MGYFGVVLGWFGRFRVVLVVSVCFVCCLRCVLSGWVFLASLRYAGLRVLLWRGVVWRVLCTAGF